jgi:hypothetical protein
VEAAPCELLKCLASPTIPKIWSAIPVAGQSSWALLGRRTTEISVGIKQVEFLSHVINQAKSGFKLEKRR